MELCVYKTDILNQVKELRQEYRCQADCCFDRGDPIGAAQFIYAESAMFEIERRICANVRVRMFSEGDTNKGG